MISKPFNVDDAVGLIGNSVDNIKMNITPAMIQLLSSEARSWWDKDELVGCGGIVIYEKGKCEAWCIVNKNLAMKLKRELLVEARRYLEEVAEKYKIEYMKATWKKDFDTKIRWLNHLGFKKEDIEGDYYIYSRSFKWA